MSMCKFQNYSFEQLIRYFLACGKEGIYWDFKQEWHEDISDLIKDIICFANTAHDENCYIIFGVSNDLNITGMKKARRKQSDIIDAISKLNFAGDNFPKISVETVNYLDVDIDIMIIYNTNQTPIYLNKAYGKMRVGCIYSRTEDKNTADNGNADIAGIESLWRKRFGLTKSPLTHIYDSLANKSEWNKCNNIFHNIHKPDFSIKIVNNYDIESDEFYSYAMPNHRTTFKTLNIKYHQTILCSHQIAVLDSGRLQIPTPDWGDIFYDECEVVSTYSYKYYTKDSPCYKILNFLYDEADYDQRHAFNRLNSIVLLYESKNERNTFEAYLESQKENVINLIDGIKKYNHIQTDNETKTALYKQRLHTSIALKKLLDEWRLSQL